MYKGELHVVILYHSCFTDAKINKVHMGLHFSNTRMGSVLSYKHPAEFVVVVTDKRLLA